MICGLISGLPNCNGDSSMTPECIRRGSASGHSAEMNYIKKMKYIRNLRGAINGKKVR